MLDGSIRELQGASIGKVSCCDVVPEVDSPADAVEHGIDAVAYSGRTPTEERQQRVREEVRTWCKKFAASADGVLKVAMGVEPGVQVHLGPAV